VPPGKMVVLGLISSKDPRLESQDQLRRRIDEAAKYVPIERLALSPQCGFASTAPGNLLTWDEQRRKLELVTQTARKVLGGRVPIFPVRLRAAPSVHSLQSCKPAARVLDEYSAHPTAPRVWGWVSGCPTPRGALQARSHIPGTRRPSWHVEPTHRARLWRFLSYLNRAISVLPV
jgi:hypothetical protein